MIFLYRIRQRINAGELVTHYYTNSYPRIGQALVYQKFLGGN